jgi:NAD(P)-dependent dehydrogenase (short-subunit alcohol dehydrogenase family)
MNIIITGAGTGIGRDTALFLSESNEHKIIAISRNRKNLEKLSADAALANISSQIQTVVFDIVNDDIDTLTGIIESFGTLDVLINNAGGLIRKGFNELEENDWTEMLQSNLLGHVRIIKAVAKYMGRDTVGHIVNIGSMGGVQGTMKFPGLSAYTAAKSALANLTEALAVEFGDLNIHVNYLALGAVETEMFRQAFPGMSAQQTSRKIAEFIGNFSTNGQKYFNGKIIPVSISTP